MTTKIGAIAVRGEWYRHARPGMGFWEVATPAADARWQRGEVVPALYLASDEQTAWAEWYRFLAEAGYPPRRALPRVLWRVAVDVDRIADLSTQAALRKVDLDVPSPGRAGWTSYQGVGERLFHEGYRGILAPAAARPAGQTLCLFRPEQRVPGVRPHGRPKLVDEPPAPPRGMRT